MLSNFTRRNFKNYKMLNEDYSEFIVTLEQVERDLIQVESILEKRIPYKCDNLRDEIIKLARENILIEDEVLSQWHCLYSTLLSFKE